MRARCTRAVMVTGTVEVHVDTGGVNIDMVAWIGSTGRKVYVVISLLSVA